MSDKEHDFEFCCLQICVWRLFTDRDQIFTWLDWSAAVAFENFFGLASEHWERKRVLFLLFFFGLTVSICQHWLGQRWPAALIGLLGLLDGPRRCARQLRAYKCPILAHLTSFLTFLSLLTSEKFFGATRALSGFGFSALICCFSLFCTRGQCLFFFFFSSLLLFYKMLEATLLGMHASAYFIFGIFISIYFLPWFMPCYLRKMHIFFLFLLYEWVNMRVHLVLCTWWWEYP